jgi:hypothetical protein
MFLIKSSKTCTFSVISNIITVPYFVETVLSTTETIGWKEMPDDYTLVSVIHDCTLVVSVIHNCTLVVSVIHVSHEMHNTPIMSCMISIKHICSFDIKLRCNLFKLFLLLSSSKYYVWIFCFYSEAEFPVKKPHLKSVICSSTPITTYIMYRVCIRTYFL